MKKLSEVAVIKSIKIVKSDSNSLYVKKVGEFEVLLESGNNKVENLIQVTPGKEVVKDYLFHILKKPLRKLYKESSDKALPAITIVKIKNIEIPIPTIEIQNKLLKSKNIEKRFQKFWLESGVRSYDEPLKIDMDFDELLKLLSGD